MVCTTVCSQTVRLVQTYTQKWGFGGARLRILCGDFTGRAVRLYRLKYSYGRKGGVWCTVKNGNINFKIILRRREHGCALCTSDDKVSHAA
jgi:hypothetical protein